MIVFLLGVLLLEATSEAARIAPVLFPSGLLVDGDIVNGIDEVPYVAIIQYMGRSICSGAIMAENKILTSAHCVMKSRRQLNNFRVRIDSSKRDSTDGSDLEIKDIKLHESFTGTHESMESNEHQVPMNDLAMIITAPMNFAVKNRSIPLFDEAEDFRLSGTTALVTGWRRIDGSEHLTTKTVYIIDDEQCNIQYHDSVLVGQICATYPGPEGKVGCLGDLGGPLVVGGRLAGILSWGNGCVKLRAPGVYTAISFYRGWIDNGGVDVHRL